MFAEPQARQTLTGTCTGGPMDGQVVMCRFPRGFLLVDRPAGRVWLYDWDGAGFEVREESGRELDHDRRLYAALEDQNFDVLAVPTLGEVSG